MPHATTGKQTPRTAGNTRPETGTVSSPKSSSPNSAKDARLLEYWDLKIKTETERVAEKKLDVEQRDWLQVKRPSMIWARTQDVMILGQKNRAIAEMFNLVKSNPQHPQVTSWISAIEAAITPATVAQPAAPAPSSPGTLAAPVPVPPATAPAAPAVDPFRLTPKPATQ